MPILIHLDNIDWEWVSGNGKMLDHDDDSLENINILRLCWWIYICRMWRDIWGYFGQCRWHPNTIHVNTYLVLFLPCTYLPCPSLYAAFFSIKKWGPRCYIRLLNMTLISFIANVIWSVGGGISMSHYIAIFARMSISWKIVTYFLLACVSIG